MFGFAPNVEIESQSTLLSLSGYHQREWIFIKRYEPLHNMVLNTHTIVNYSYFQLIIQMIIYMYYT